MLIESLQQLIVPTQETQVLEPTAQLASSITDVFFVVIVAVFLLATLLRLFNKKPVFTDYAPTLLSSLGILGTFAGIVIGLLAFNPKDIDSSITNLLWGLQTAFFTSIIGVFLSIAFKGFESILTRQAASNIEGGVINELSLNELMSQQNAYLAQIAKSINDEHTDSSLVNLMKLYRSDTSDYRKQLSGQLQQIGLTLESDQKLLTSHGELFAEMLQQQKIFADQLWLEMTKVSEALSKSATEQVISALKQVIVDFNNNLTEQFGENFKQLNAAVGALVQWQENYRHQLEQMIDQYTQGVQAIIQTETSVAHISQESAQIPIVMDKLKSVLDINQHQIDGLNEHLQVFQTMRDKAIEAVPQIERRIDETITGVQQASSQMIAGINESATNLSNAIIKTADEFDESSSRVNGALQTTSDHLSVQSEELKNNLLDAVKQIREDFYGFLGQLQDRQQVQLTAVENSVAAMLDGYQQSQTSVAEFAQQTTQQLSGHSDAIKQVVEQSLSRVGDEFSALISSMQSNHQTQLKSFESAITQLVNAYKESEAQIKNFAQTTISGTSESVLKQTSALDMAMEKELQSAMNDMGSTLTSITKKFTEDYQVLVNEMSKVVRSR
ncbi:MAG TPA: hypothetical protein PLU46_08960 [Thiotrichales bacterium]|nr:hypothetical protein [Thiotrichales bacterium]